MYESREIRYELTALDEYYNRIRQYDLLTREEEVALGTLVRAGIDAATLLSDEDLALDEAETAELQQVVEQGRVAHEAFVNANLRLVVSVAKRMLKDVPMEEKIQEGNFGLMHAVNKFDPNKGFKFSTYATWWIRQAIAKAPYETLLLPSHVKEELRKYYKARDVVALRVNRAPTEEEIIEEIGEADFKHETILLALSASNVQSLDEPLFDDHGSVSVGATVIDARSEGMSEKVDARLEVQYVLPQLVEKAKIDQRSLMMLSLRFGVWFDQLDSVTVETKECAGVPFRYVFDRHVHFGQHTLEEVAAVFELTRERTRQVINNAISRMQVVASKRIDESDV